MAGLLGQSADGRLHRCRHELERGQRWQHMASLNSRDRRDSQPGLCCQLALSQASCETGRADAIRDGHTSEVSTDANKGRAVSVQQLLSDPSTDDRCLLGNDCVAQRSQSLFVVGLSRSGPGWLVWVLVWSWWGGPAMSVQPAGNPISISTHCGFSRPGLWGSIFSVSWPRLWPGLLLPL